MQIRMEERMMRIVFLSFSLVFFTGPTFAKASEGVSICLAKSSESDCIQARAQLEVSLSKKSFVLLEYIEGIQCWTPNLPRNRSGIIVEVPGMAGRPDYKFIATDGEIIGSVQSDFWTQTYTGIIDGFYFRRCSID